MFKIQGMRRHMEDNHKVNKYRRFLEGRGTSGKGLVQFWAVQGGLRTIDVGDIIAINGVPLS